MTESNFDWASFGSIESAKRVVRCTRISGEIHYEVSRIMSVRDSLRQLNHRFQSWQHCRSMADDDWVKTVCWNEKKSINSVSHAAGVCRSVSAQKGHLLFNNSSVLNSNRYVVNEDPLPDSSTIQPSTILWKDPSTSFEIDLGDYGSGEIKILDWGNRFSLMSAVWKLGFSDLKSSPNFWEQTTYHHTFFVSIFHTVYNGRTHVF